MLRSARRALDAFFNPYVFAYKLRAHAVSAKGSPIPFRIDFRGVDEVFDARFIREGHGIRLVLHPDIPPAHVHGFRWLFRSYLYWFSQCDDRVRSMTVVGNDSAPPSKAVFSPSADPKEHVLIPDPYFYRWRGWEEGRRASEAALPWDKRSEDIVWRGARNGQGKPSTDLADEDNPAVIPRYRLVMKLRSQPGCDARLNLVKGKKGHARIGPREAEEIERGFIGETVPEPSWMGRKFAIDIDGSTNTWSNLILRLHYGCCVLKVESQHNFAQWYYDRLKPFEHYVPVKPDMSDLLDQIEWARSHDSEARQIAANGQAFIRTLDFETGRREAVEIISKNWNN
jgi:hypothetical protein